MLKERYRNAISNIDAYIPGKSIEDVKLEYNLDRVIRLASNENPLGPPPRAIEAAEQAMQEIHLYPESTAKILRERLANLYKINTNEIMTANGADEILSLLIAAYINKGDEIVYCIPTFPTYRSETLLMEGIPVEIPLNQHWEFDLNKMLQSITDKTKMVIICNPNNPTGTMVSQEELNNFLHQVPKHVLVVLDEAFIEYYEKKNNDKTGIDFFKTFYDQIIVVRTFSKFYGLAGLRIGYAIGIEKNLEPVQRIRPPFATNRPAIAAAVAALQDKAFTSKQVKENEVQKEYMEKELSKLGFLVIPSATNFLFVHMKMDVTYLFENLLSKGIIIRPCAPWGLHEYARITIGTKEQNEQLIQHLKVFNENFSMN